jgi:hypothetical protein
MGKNIIEIIDILEEKRRLSRTLNRQIRNIKKEKQLISEDSFSDYVHATSSSGEHTLVYNMFVQPFIDVLKSAKLLAMDLSNSIQLAWSALTIVDADDLEEAIENFNEKRQEINKDWEPLLKKVNSLIGSQDPIYKLSLLGPEVFYGLEGLGVGLLGGKTIAEILTAIRWEKLKDNFKTRLSPDENLTRNSRRLQMLNRKMLRKLNSLFFIKSSHVRESAEPENITEAFDTPSQEQPMTEKQAVDEFLRITGLNKSLEELKIANAENIIITANDLNQKIKPLLYASSILSAENLEQLLLVFSKMKSDGAVLNISPERISKDIDTQASLLLNNPKFLESVKSKGNPSIDEINKIAYNAVFAASKESINLKIISEITNITPVIDSAIKSLKIDNDILSLMKNDKESVVKMSAKIYEELLNSYKNIKADLSKAM